MPTLLILADAIQLHRPEEEKSGPVIGGFQYEEIDGATAYVNVHDVDVFPDEGHGVARISVAYVQDENTEYGDVPEDPYAEPEDEPAELVDLSAVREKKGKK